MCKKESREAREARGARGEEPIASSSRTISVKSGPPLGERLAREIPSLRPARFASRFFVYSLAQPRHAPDSTPQIKAAGPSRGVYKVQMR
ncbi:hypothetical protein E2C01_071481 [Portunus trituberculatus]|uniref:Uncharacterized protein n=1 Tax=Portunus trituberculatus TaxID=210409 RepID=A0A5B7I031_PORTR|nr:hypothetical protein [Portunus trituberculatus]